MLALHHGQIGGLVLILAVASANMGPLTGAPAIVHHPTDEELAWKFGALLAVVEDNFIGDASTERLVRTAIDGMLSVLDEQSVYVVPASAAGAPPGAVSAAAGSEETEDSVATVRMLDGSVGWIGIRRFDGSTAGELDQALSRLKEQGMQDLVLDLRGNRGGRIDDAAAVAERFIPQGELLASTLGRSAASRRKFIARPQPQYFDGALIVLVDHKTAAGGELVSGAIQDHDRGLIVGEPTEGNSFVQRAIPLRDGGVLLLTTARFHLPSGRDIGRGRRTIESTSADDRSAPRVFHTSLGREFHGGDGVQPDHFIAVPNASGGDTPEFVRALDLLEEAQHLWRRARQDVPDDAHRDGSTSGPSRKR